ncbi:MAG: ABC transporter ATP-binding protein [Ruminococcaceae bacterium]|nr:ABC transporter ATP-binding protein [Oscillospiraceae bacterium]
MMHHFWQQVRKVRLTIILGLTMAILNAACDLFWPTIIATIVDDGITPGNPAHIKKMLIVMVVVAVLAACVKYAKNACAITTGNRYSRNMRQALFEKVLSLPGGDAARFGAAALVTRCTNDITAIGGTLDSFIRVMVRIPITCVGGLILAFIMDPHMALIILAVVPFIAILSIYMLKSTTPKYTKIQNALDRFNRVLREKLWGVRVIRVFCRDGYEQTRLDEANDEITATTTEVERRIGLLNPLMTTLVNLTVLGLVIYAAVRASRDALHIGALISCIQYANQILMAIVQSTMLMSRIPRTAVSVRRVEEVMQHASTVPDTGTRLPEGDTDALHFDGACYRYPGTQLDALHDLTFTVRKGQTTAIIGSTGSGKTTLLNLAERFIDPTDGALRLGDTDLRDIPQKELRRRLAVVPQQAFLFEGSIRDNLRYGAPDATEEDLRAALDVAQASEFVFSFEDGLDHHVASGGSNLSGGQRQRLAIARALLCKPDFYLFDDSFSALDLKTDAAVRRGLKAATADSAFLIVAQRIGTIRDADQIVVLDGGRIVGIGKHEQLLQTCSVYREIAESQYEGSDDTWQ